MSGVTFNEEPSYQQSAPEPKGLYKLAIKLGLAKTEMGAKIALIVIALVAIVIAVVYPMLVL